MRAVILDGHNDLVYRRWRGEALKHIDLARAAEADFCGGFFAIYVPGADMLEPADAPYDLPLEDAIPLDEARRVAERAGGGARGPRRPDRAPRPRLRARPRDGDHAPRGRRRTRARPLGSGGLVRPGPALARHRLVAAQRVRRGRAVPLPRLARHGPRPDRRRPRARHRLQPARDPRRRLASERGRLLGRRAHLARAARRDALERARAERLDAQPHRRPARRDRPHGRRRRHQLRRRASCARTATRSADTPLGEIVRHVDYVAERIGVDCVAFGSDFEGAVVPAELGGIDGLPRLVDGAPRARLRRRGAREDHARQLAARARPDVAALGPLLRSRGRGSAPHAASTQRTASPSRASPSTSAPARAATRPSCCAAAGA